MKCSQKIVTAVLVLACGGVAFCQWSQAYEDGLKAAERSQWVRAAERFRAAIASKPKPELNALGESGITTLDYLPYYHLGRALFFSRAYNQAVESFDRELEFGVITSVQPLQQNLEILHAAALLLQLPAAENSPRVEIAAALWQELLSAGYRRGAGETVPVDTLLRRLTGIDDELQSALVSWFRGHPAKTPAPLHPAPEQASPLDDSIAVLSRQAFGAFLQGRYQDAFSDFRRLEQLQPTEALWGSWQERARLELTRLNLPAPEAVQTSVTDTVIQTVSPLILIIAPENETARTRADSIRLAGIVKDDLGVASVAFAVNGRLLSLLPQQRPQIDDDGSYRFDLFIPLRMGENEIAVTATDVDADQHIRTLSRRVIRAQPLYRTLPFWFAAGAVALLLTGSLVALRLIKNRIAFLHRYNPYVAGAPIRDEAMFFGREQLVERILRTLPNNSVMVYGPRRIGKTSLQYRLQRRLLDADHPEYHFVPVMIDLQGVPESHFFAHLIDEVRDQVPSARQRLASRVQGEDYSQRQFARHLRQMIDALQQQLQTDSDGRGHKQVRLVLQMDEVDELNRYSERTNQQLRAVFMKAFSENLVAVMTGSRIREQWESESSPWYNFFEQVPMPLLTREEALALIHRPVAGFYRFEPAAAEKIWLASGGQPFVIQKFCVRLINLAIDARHRKITSADAEAVSKEVLADTV